MLDEINNMILLIADPLLGWMLWLPQDVALLIIALLTGLVLTGVRKFTTDQSYLARCAQDKTTLKRLMKEAKKKSDKDAKTRIRRTLGQIGVKSMTAEGKPLLASIIPIAIFAVWAFSRIAYIAPQEGDVITMKMYFPISAIDSYVHIIPVDGIACENGWIQKVVDDVPPAEDIMVLEVDFAPELPDSEKTTISGDVAVLNGVATWAFRCDLRDEPYHISIRHGDRVIEKQIIYDGIHYTEPFMPYGDLFEEVIEFKAEEYKLFGVVPGINSLALAPWMMGYLLIVIPLAFILKPVMRIY